MKRGIKWDAEPLGLVPDPEIAARLGCTREAVAYARQQRGIPSPTPIRQKCDPVQFAHLLDGTLTDREIAQRFNLTSGQVSYARRVLGKAPKRRDWDRVAAIGDLGSMPDSLVAKKYGVNNKVVAEARWSRGIPAWREERQCVCGRSFVARQWRQHHCSTACFQRWWECIKRGMHPEAAACAVAVWAYKRTMKHRT